MNYKIIFQIKTPIAFSDNIMFDGLIAYAFAQESKRVNNGRLSFSKDEMIDFSKMPILMDSDSKYFMASWMFYEKDNLIEHLGSWKKRWANEDDEYADFGKNIRKVRINNADFKSYNMPIRLVDVPKCWFYFQSNNLSEVERLIKTYIVGLGKKVSQGNGIIDSFEIVELENNPFDEIVRPIPTDKPNANTQFIGFRPPYWLPENQGHCLIQ